jgi:hypothetical protein
MSTGPGRLRPFAVALLVACACGKVRDTSSGTARVPPGNHGGSGAVAIDQDGGPAGRRGGAESAGQTGSGGAADAAHMTPT